MFGLWMRVSIAKVFEISPHFNFALPSLLIITGSIMMLVGVLACFCSSTDSPILLYIVGGPIDTRASNTHTALSPSQLSGIFFLIFCLILASSITGYTYRDNLKKQLYKSLNHSLMEYGTGNILDKDLDRVQIHVGLVLGVSDSYSSGCLFPPVRMLRR